jgi:hypothetical protein
MQREDGQPVGYEITAPPLNQWLKRPLLYHCHNQWLMSPLVVAQKTRAKNIVKSIKTSDNRKDGTDTTAH